MTDEIKKMTAHSSSVGADDGQSISQNSKTTIPDSDEKSTVSNGALGFPVFCQLLLGTNTGNF